MPPNTNSPIPSGATAEIGISGLKRWSGMLTEEFLPELRGRRGVAIYDEMRKNDAVIGATLRATKDIIRGVRWEATGAEKKFLTECMGDMSHTWNTSISDALTCMPFGWALQEVTYKVRAGPGGSPPSKYDDGRIGLRKIALRGQDTLLDWVIDDHGGIQGMRQQTPKGSVEIPIAKCLLFRIDPERNNPEGTSMLRPCYRSWYMRKNLEEIEGIGIERDLTGIPKIQLPRNATTADYNAGLDILERLKNDEQSGVIFWKGNDPDGRDDWDFVLVNSPGTKQIHVGEVIQRYSTEIALTFLAQFLQLGQSGAHSRGSYSLSRNQIDFFYVAVSSIVDNMTETINSFLIPPLMRLNGLPENSVSLTHGRIAPREITGLVNLLGSMAKVGLLEPDTELAHFIRREYDLPEGPAVVKRQRGAPTPVGSNGHIPEPAPSSGDGGGRGDNTGGSGAGGGSKA